jgi:hypothetical protein
VVGDVDERKPKPWERQPGEKAMWYRRFWAWLNHPRRSMLAVYQEEREERRKKARKSPKKPDSKRGRRETTGVPGRWKEIAQEWDWEGRAGAWDEYQESLARQAVEEAALILRQSAPRAAQRIVDIVGSEDDKEARQASAEVLDRSGVSRVTRREITGEGGKPLIPAASEMTDEELDDRIRQLIQETQAGAARAAGGEETPEGQAQ